MANFIEGGIDAFRALAYGDHHPNNITYMENVANYATENWNASADRFKESIRSTYDSILGSKAIRLAKAVKRQSSGLVRSRRVQHLKTIAEVQAPPKEMIPYLMVEPVTRSLYQRQLCAGYDDEYIDLYASRKIKDHPLYQNVMNGMIEDTDDGWESTTYYPDMLEDDLEELEFTDQVEIINTFETMASAMLNKGDDCTSRFNASLI